MSTKVNKSVLNLVLKNDIILLGRESMEYRECS